MPNSPLQLSTKRLAIVKANARIVATVGVAAFVTVFCLVADKAIFSQNQYQGRVTQAKQQAHDQLVKNITAANNLVTSYKTFVGGQTNVIGGSTTGTGDNDGDNAKIVLDSLPDSYDFPALASSLEKILDSLSIKGNISGTDNQLSQSSSSTANPQPVSMPFTISATDISYTAVQQLIARLQASIRPMQIDTLDLAGAPSSMTMTINGHTYFQPGKSLSITTETVR